ncbi:hypothetical protein EZV62_012319 [Acer yangbiense]|uniref:Uncharacterized protein n=1 Tax=Acer yangbiense TaxID=1000413 RepID=A0A5C7HX94_9ROSI|nr:hypothetical protein EZV62_012319 [Acer yangbiense]
MLTMDAKELERLCGALSIQELEGLVKSLDEGMKTMRERKLAFCLVGKDQNRIINGGPWNFDKAIVVLEKMPLDGDITNLEYNKVEFWIQVHKIPHLCMSKEIGIFLGKLIGDVKEVDLAIVREENNRSLKVDLMGTGKVTTMLLRYERLQDYCFKCKRIGHGIREYSLEGDIREVTSEANYRLCMWLCTRSLPKKMQNRFGRQENVNTGTYMGSHGVKENRVNHGRSQEFWRSSKSLLEGKAGERKRSTSKSSWREKENGPLISKDSCMGSLEEAGGVQSGKNKPREVENDVAAMCIDLGLKNVEILQDPKEAKTYGPGHNREVNKRWKLVNRVSLLLDKQNSLGIELGKRSEEALANDLRASKKNARVYK